MDKKIDAKQPDDDIVITFDEPDCIEITIEDDEVDKKPKYHRNTQNATQMPSKLYLDNVTMPSAQVQCSSCQFVCNLPQGKADVTEERCGGCGRLKIALGEKTQCCFCEMEGVVMAHSKHVHDDYRKRYNQKPQFGKSRGKPRGRK